MKRDSKGCQSIGLQGGTIIYSLREELVWQMPVEELAALGEYTDPNGPYVDDYFFVFVRKPDHKYWIASFYASDSDKFLDHLGVALGDPLYPGLCHSTEYASRVLWSPAIIDTQLFDFVPIQPDSMWARIKQRLIPTCEMRLTNSVVEYLERDNQSV
jgi:hypothetical protein